MAVLTAAELAALRRKLRQLNPDVTVDFTKDDINATLQAAEDAFEAWRSTFGAAMQNATAYTWSNPQLKAIGSVYLELKARNERG